MRERATLKLKEAEKALTAAKNEFKMTTYRDRRMQDYDDALADSTERILIEVRQLIEFAVHND